MKNYFCIISIFIMCIIFYSCNNSPNEPVQELYSINGKVMNSNGAVEGAKISVNKSINWTVSTDEEGKFNINNVSKGEHNLFLEYTDTNGSFVEQNNQVSVFSNINLESLLLPTPVVLDPPFDITMNSLKIVWRSTDALDFYEYKLFRRDTPGLDENTGELIYVGTNRTETIYIDENLLSQKIYYYRVYIMNQYGRLGGSNIVSAETEFGNLIPDGGFENMEELIRNWNINRGSGSDYITILDDEIKMDGNYSLYNHNAEPYTDSTINTYTMLKLNKPVLLVPQITYKLSGWFKAKGQYTDIGGVFVDISQGQNGLVHMRFEPAWSDSVDVDWTYKEETFFVTNDEPVEIQIYIPIENVWIDNLSLEPKQ